MGWPLSRSTKAAASRALSFSEATDAAAGDLSGRFFFAAGAGVVVIRFFLAGMASLLGRKLAREAAPVAPPHQGRRTTSTAPPPPGNCRRNLRSFSPGRHATASSRRGRDRAPELAPAPPLLVPVQRRRHVQHVTQRQRLPAAGGTLEEEQVFLQVGGKIQQACD